MFLNSFSRKEVYMFNFINYDGFSAWVPQSENWTEQFYVILKESKWYFQVEMARPTSQEIKDPAGQ